MGYTLLDTETRGDTTKDHTMRVSVLKAKNPSQSALDSAYNGVVDFLNQVMDRQYDNHGMKIPGFVAKKYETDKGIDCSNKFESGNNWLDNNNFGEGHYTWVFNCGNANSAESAQEGAWERRTQSFVTTDWYGNGHYLSVMAIHETLHAFVTDSCTNVQQHTEFGWDHELGHDIYQNGSNNCTPLAASYEDESQNYESKGQCNRDKTTDGVTRTLSECTIKSLQDSREHAYFNGAH